MKSGYNLKDFCRNKQYATITYGGLIKTLDAMVRHNILHESWSSESITYLVVEGIESAFVPDTQSISSIPIQWKSRKNLEKNYLEYMKSPQEDVNRTSSNNIKFQRKFGGNL